MGQSAVRAAMALHESLAFVLAQTTLEGQRAVESVGQMKAELAKQRHENGRLTMQACTMIVHGLDGQRAGMRVPAAVWPHWAQFELDVCEAAVCIDIFLSCTRLSIGGRVQNSMPTSLAHHAKNTNRAYTILWLSIIL